MLDPLQSVLSNIQGGKLRAIAVSSKARSPTLSNVPTIAESGHSETFLGNLEQLGVLPTVLTGRAFAEFQAGELVKWGKAVRDSGAAAD
jgi:hypothetical protein